MTDEEITAKSLVGAVKFLSRLDKVEQLRKDMFRLEEKGWVVDTCQAADTEKWETGIFQNGLGGDCLIVEQYGSREEAEKGHERWVSLMRKNPKQELPDLNVWETEQ
jgi:hypothetical protein